MIDAIKSRVDILSQSRNSQGMDAAKLAAAKEGLASATAVG